MTPEDRFNALNSQIDTIEYSYPQESPEREAILALNTMLFRVLSRPDLRATTAQEIKDHLRAHKDSPELLRNLITITGLFADMVEAGFEAIKAEQGH